MGLSISSLSSEQPAEPKAGEAAAGQKGAGAAKGEHEVVDEAVNQAASAVKAVENLHGVLKVFVKGASQLDDISLSGKPMDVQVKCTILGQSFRTPVAKGAGTSAAFDYSFEVRLDGVLGTMFVEVVQVDGLQTNTIGFGEVELAVLLDANGARQFDITRDGETSVGKFQLASEFTPKH